MINNSLFKKVFLGLTVIFMASCDKDFNEIGGDLLGDNNFELNKQSFGVSGYNQKTGVVQSNNLDVNPLGIYNSSNFGETTANFNTQLTLATAVTSVSTNPFIESVVLTVPYFVDNSQTKNNTDGSRTYVLDSIYGPEKAKMKLSVYESGFFMRDADPNGGFQQQQRYFSDQNADFDNFKKPNRLNDSSDKSQNDEFFFDATAKKTIAKDTVTKVETTTYGPPEMQLNLNKSYFKTRIIDAINSGKLANNDVFKNYFRGLYFKIEKAGTSPGNLAMLNFKSGKITIKYNEDLVTTTGGVTTTTRVKKTIELNMTGNAVSLLSNDFSTSGSAYNNLPFTGNTSTGDDKFFLRGGEGSLAVVELFDKTDVKGYTATGTLTGPNGISDQLDDLRFPADGKKLLVNEANLVFHIDASAMASSVEPQRIYLYDFTNNRVMFDYAVDDTDNTFDAKKGKVIYGGQLVKNATTKRGASYKIRITNHLRNLINNKDSTNVKLGLVVTEDIIKSTSYKVKSANSFVREVPVGSVMNPLGTILFGGNSSVPADKRLKLEIYFTKPN
ncbi:hypothetical protein FVB9288_03358 [Flavobacterium sp. CECT 9288]|uniref:DUF4270 domain-containing protein n=1 Tax=Flavobacterium sp. CECT 9288 TaxID=2845819 RepID=UPI001E4D2643|nr:DUF4270 domain-containing protein [Flavobacterium sp. CECT 9288]CAH0337589.1 hypothetical protein FVB9288_03358 [Flavobacterium sp. CECT 9288]